MTNLIAPDQPSASGTHRLPGGIPIPILALGLPLAGLVFVAVATHLHSPLGQSPQGPPVLTADLVMQDYPDGSITVSRAGDPASHGCATLPAVAVAVPARGAQSSP